MTLGFFQCFSPKAGKEGDNYVKSAMNDDSARVRGGDSPSDTVHGMGAVKWLLNNPQSDPKEVPLMFTIPNLPDALPLPVAKATGYRTKAAQGVCHCLPLDPTKPAMKMWYSTSTKMGTKGINQDSIMSWTDFLTCSMSENGDVLMNPDDKKMCRSSLPLLGVYDGHGMLGHWVSALARDLVPSNLRAQLKTRECEGAGIDWQAEFKEAYRATDEIICSLKAYNGGPSRVDARTAGCTGMTVVLDGCDLHVSSVGDSRVVLGRMEGSQVVVIGTSEEHRPTEAGERARIVAGGGLVRSVPTEPHRERFWPPDVQDAIDGKCVLSSPGLCMSRAFGDSVLKKWGLLATPWAKTYTLSPEETYILIVSTDGVWDVMLNETALSVVANAPTDSNAADVLIQQATEQWKIRFPKNAIDDMGVAVAVLTGLPAAQAEELARSCTRVG